MTYIDLHHAHDRPGLPPVPKLDGVREVLTSALAGATFMLLAAAAAVLGLWLGGGRLLRRFMA